MICGSILAIKRLNLFIVTHELRNVHEQELSEMASMLENAGRERNSDSIESCLGAFIQNLEKLASSLNQNDEEYVSI